MTSFLFGKGRRLMAACDRKRKVIWGVGDTRREALADARYNLSLESPELQKRGFGDIEYGRLESAPEEALRLYDGEELYPYVRLERDGEAKQLSLISE